VSELVSLALKITDEEWAADTWRQKTFEVHAHTEVLPLLYDEDLRHENPTPREAWPYFETALRPVLDRVRRELGDGYFLRVILTRLAPLSHIPVHSDHGDSLPFVHRLHVPLVTSERVRFQVGDETRNLAVGTIWEINNQRRHAVRNEGDSARVHLIIDYVTPALERRRELSQLARALLRR